jgi:hypothetical protein
MNKNERDKSDDILIDLKNNLFLTNDSKLKNKQKKNSSEDPVTQDKSFF